jgi:hypothetical protein
VQNVQEAADTALVNEITKTADSRQAMRWLARQLAWEGVLSDLRDENPTTTVRAA